MLLIQMRADEPWRSRNCGVIVNLSGFLRKHLLAISREAMAVNCRLKPAGA